MLEPHCARERESDFEPLVGQPLETRILCQSGRRFLPRPEKPILPLFLRNVFPGAVLKILLNIAAGLAAQLI